MTKKQILGFKPTARLEQVDDEHSKRAQDRKHQVQDAIILAYDATRGWMEFSERTAVKWAFSAAVAVAAVVIGLR